jgi:signal transduction histidine kinase
MGDLGIVLLSKQSRPSILAIDDTPTNLLTLGAALNADYQLRFATSGEEGLAQAEASPPDLILLDIMMPEMDGYEVCRRLKAVPKLHDIPVIFVTALVEVDAEAVGLALGAADYLTKPININIARQRIANLIERERLRREVEAQRDHLEELVQQRTAALSIAKEAAEASNRAKTTFLSNMSHELRTPMNGIMGMTQLAMRRATDSKQKDQLEKVEQSARRLLGIINDILDISKIEADHLTLEDIDFNLGDVLSHLTGLVGLNAEEKGLTLVVEVAPEMASRPFRGDPLRLGQILLNLTANAIKFTAEGSVTICVHAAEDNLSDALIRFEVRDTGIGIAMEDQQRIFANFEQVDGSTTRKYGGSGLGLAISSRLARAMGGNIGVQSQIGSGSTFWLTTRLAKSKYPADTVLAKSKSSAEYELKARFTGACILLAEDDLICQEIACALMEEAGLRVDLAGDGVEAVEMTKQTKYDLIVMDMQMPKLDGVEAARMIRSLPGREHIPVIAMTANAFPADSARCLDAGMNAFISKPVDPDMLFETLLLWLDQSRD